MPRESFLRSRAVGTPVATSIFLWQRGRVNWKHRSRGGSFRFHLEAKLALRRLGPSKLPLRRKVRLCRGALAAVTSLKMAGLPGGGPRSSPGSAGGGDDTQHIAIAQAHIGRAQQKADEICAVLQPALHRDEPARAGVCGDEDERRALREQVAALQQELAALRACLPATSTTVASDTVEPASNTVEPEEVSGVGLEDTRMCVRASMCKCERRER